MLAGRTRPTGISGRTPAIANAYVEQNYFSYARSYPFNGSDPLAYSPNGFLWNAAMHAGKSVRVYGEFVDKPSIIEQGKPVHPTWSQLWNDYKSGKRNYTISANTGNAALRPCLSPNYIGFPLVVSDQWRADQFLADFRKFESDRFTSRAFHFATARESHLWCGARHAETARVGSRQ